MNLLSLNVHAWMEDHQDQKLEHLADTIAAKDYDLIALQEVNQTIAAPIADGEVRADNYGLILLGLLEQRGVAGYSYHWSTSHIGYDVYDEGIALLSRYPVLEAEGFYTSKSQDIHTIDSRKIIRLKVEVDGQAVEVYSCHMNLPTSQTENQVDNLKRLVSHTDFAGVKIFMGDFNTDAISNPQAYQTILDQGLLDTYQLAETKDSGVTVCKSIDGWKGQSQDKRLDYVFVNQEVPVQTSRIIFNGQNQEVVSDHFGLEVALSL
ncbi:endonuclease/exonuclease/phosphatase family protein [Streptococcus sobrinus]|uniref:endonuclease/exonuclease/phosphatase family protein n=1 Tax=Streptococcus sobrinus TaxID=1310 RepID=UPI0003177CEA|nr:endonuclease/exonuclease/phosphatase family protein [Streptococcus sobrinus]